jgi:hypothetical protein
MASSACSALAPLLFLVLAASGCGGGGKSASAPPSSPARVEEAATLDSNDADAVARAADALAEEVSPWQRALGVAARKRELGTVPIGRPAGRPVKDPRAGVLEEKAIAAYQRLGREPLTYPRTHARERLVVLLGEVASDRGAEYLRTELAGATAVEAALPLMTALETIYGLPPFYEPHALGCGETGDDEVPRRHKAEEARRFFQGRQALLAWLDTNAKKPRAERIDQALAAWDKHGWHLYPNLVAPGMSNLPALLQASIVRLGDDALPGLRSRKAAAKDDESKGPYEMLIAVITGKEDEALVRRLLAERYGKGPGIALAIIAAAGSKRWVRELDAMQTSRDSLDDAHTASKVLAAVLGREALPLLEAAAAKEPENFTAKYAAEEIREGK